METIRDQEHLPEIRSWYVVRSTPLGEAPFDIRQRWIGIALPVRERAPGRAGGRGILSDKPVDMRSAVPVRTLDAIEALRAAGQEEAAEWWQDYHSHHPNAAETLLFDTEWGEFVDSKILSDFQTEPFND